MAERPIDAAVAAGTRGDVIGSRLEPELLVAIRPAGAGNWAPAGREIAFTRADPSGRQHLWAVSAAGGSPRRLSAAPIALEMSEGTDRRDVWGGPQWSPTDDRLTFLSTASHPAGGSSVWTVGLDGRGATEITRHAGDDRTPRWSPGGRRIAFVCHRDGRDAICVVPGGGGVALQLTYDRWDNTDPDWAPDGRAIAFISQRSDVDVFSNSLCVLGPDDGRVTRLTDDDRANDRSPRWSPDGRTIAFVSNREGTDDIWCVAPDGARLRRLSDGAGDKGDPRWSPDGRWIAYTHAQHGDINLFVMPATGGDPQPTASGGVNEAPRWSPDGRELLYLRSGPDAPGDLWIARLDAGAAVPARRITDVAAGALDGMAFSTPQAVTYGSADGQEIEGLLYGPVPASGERGPAILWIHGGPNAQHTNGWAPLIQYLAQRGYTIFAPNYRGSTGYGRAFMEANIGPGSGVDVEDWIAAAAFLRRLPSVDPGRVGIMGRSAGGFATLLALGISPETFQAGIAIAAPTNWLTHWDEARMPWIRRLRVKLMGLQGTNLEDYRKRSPVEYAEAFRAPVLILHGEDDPGPPSRQALEMAEALQRHGKPHECVLYPGEGHVFTAPEAIRDSTARIEGFLSAHLGVRHSIHRSP